MPIVTLQLKISAVASVSSDVKHTVYNFYILFCQNKCIFTTFFLNSWLKLHVAPHIIFHFGANVPIKNQPQFSQAAYTDSPIFRSKEDSQFQFLGSWEHHQKFPRTLRPKFPSCCKWNLAIICASVMEHEPLPAVISYMPCLKILQRRSLSRSLSPRCLLAHVTRGYVCVRAREKRHNRDHGAVLMMMLMIMTRRRRS